MRYRQREVLPAGIDKINARARAVESDDFMALDLFEEYNRRCLYFLLRFAKMPGICYNIQSQLRIEFFHEKVRYCLKN